MNNFFPLQMFCMCRILKMELNYWGGGGEIGMGELVWAGEASVLRTSSTL